MVVKHGNGPRVGLLALEDDSYDDGEPYPLDIVDAESGGQIGYVIGLELGNAIDHTDTVTVITRVLVDSDDPAFGNPTKFIGPVYDEPRAWALAAERGWVVKADGEHKRRVAASPRSALTMALDRRVERCHPQRGGGTASRPSRSGLGRRPAGHLSGPRDRRAARDAMGGDRRGPVRRTMSGARHPRRRANALSISTTAR